jgi:luciferase family oxidoreductase group 1
MNRLSEVPFSILDLAPIVAGATASDAFHNSLDLARHAEQWDYKRYWLAEHHNIPGIASAATAVVIGYIAGGTSRIRVGSGGIMLPNHSPLVIAEQFGTLESLYPGRIDLGLGRAPGSDQQTARAMRRSPSAADSFPQDVMELQAYLGKGNGGRGVRAIPGEGTDVPIWLLGSSDFGARLAAKLGLPYAFASHFAPDHLLDALQIYRDEFQPSSSLAQPYAMVGVNLFAADTDDEAYRLFTSLQQQFLGLVRGTPGQLKAPVDEEQLVWNSLERAHVQRMTRISAVGSPPAVRDALEKIVTATGANELMLTAQLFDHQARLRSFEIAAQLRQPLN